MNIFGTFVAIILAILASIFLGPYGGILVLAMIFGLILSTHQRNKKIHEDLQRIKEHLGIEDKDDFNMTEEEIEKELEQEQEQEELNESEELVKINEEIEKELEQYLDKNNDQDKGL
ncbi:hypothetical protein [Paenibacillus sp. N3.4]|uniref:hypothetical protein n=1 Tax=Paenibacillus sp. N3.4 TaxID=2603222 RepID=UPI0011C9FC16|nr:hypothetical protein [Paenibacillus sp. N3.4]TXK80388.1 hypothetical protein FU659_18400 [Paenibacillus sp. N3.4]